MAAYILRRVVLIVPTLIAIITINFFIVQIAPGGPVDQMISNMSGIGGSNMIMERISGQGQTDVGGSLDTTGPAGGGTGGDGGIGGGGSPGTGYRGARGLDPEVIAEIEKRFGFDKPLHVRYVEMLKRYAVFDFGESLFRGRSVVGLIIDRLPVSISLGLWST